jgi:hypothetical protein
MVRGSASLRLSAEQVYDALPLADRIAVLDALRLLRPENHLSARSERHRHSVLERDLKRREGRTASDGLRDAAAGIQFSDAGIVCATAQADFTGKTATGRIFA